MDKNKRSPFIFTVTFWSLNDQSCLVPLLWAQNYCRGTKQQLTCLDKIPSPAKVEEYKQLVVGKYPALTNVWAAMDGLKTPIQQASTTKQQWYFYNGWKHNHFVTSVFCFCPNGTIPIAYMNLLGTMHDSTIADMEGIYDKLKNLYERTGAITPVLIQLFE